MLDNMTSISLTSIAAADMSPAGLFEQAVLRPWTSDRALTSCSSTSGDEGPVAGATREEEGRCGASLRSRSRPFF